MRDLIEALVILSQYTDKKYPTHCEHDKLIVFVDPDDVSPRELDRLYILGFEPDYDEDCFYSFRYGSS